MSRQPLPIGADGLNAISYAPGQDIKLFSTATSGLSTAIGRDVELSISEENLHFLLGCLIRRDPEMFIRIGDAVRAADIHSDKANTPNDQMTWRRGSGVSWDQLIKDAITGRKY